MTTKHAAGAGVAKLVSMMVIMLAATGCNTKPSQTDTVGESVNTSDAKSAEQDRSETVDTTRIDVSAEEAQAIAKEAYVWGFPIVMNYKTMFNCVLDQENSEYKGPFNQLSCAAKLTMTDNGPRMGNIALKGRFDRRGLDPELFGAHDRKGAEASEKEEDKKPKEPQPQ